jgi:hypothetical protein
MIPWVSKHSAERLGAADMPGTPQAHWALRHRFTQLGTCRPFTNYTYAEQAPPDEAVP